MSISKNYLLEQINRSRTSIADENRLYDLDTNNNHLCDVCHNRGHLFVLDELEDFIKNNNYNKKTLRKMLKKYRIIANELSKEIESKYEKDIDAIDLPKNRKDYIKLFLYYGIECEANCFKEIINGNYYVDKSAYTPTDWEGWINNK
jgi:hypothetical protein